MFSTSSFPVLCTLATQCVVEPPLACQVHLAWTPSQSPYLKSPWTLLQISWQQRLNLVSNAASVHSVPSGYINGTVWLTLFYSLPLFSIKCVFNSSRRKLNISNWSNLFVCECSTIWHSARLSQSLSTFLQYTVVIAVAQLLTMFLREPRQDKTLSFCIASSKLRDSRHATKGHKGISIKSYPGYYNLFLTQPNISFCGWCGKACFPTQQLDRVPRAVFTNRVLGNATLFAAGFLQVHIAWS